MGSVDAGAWSGTGLLRCEELKRKKIAWGKRCAGSPLTLRQHFIYWQSAQRDCRLAGGLRPVHPA